MRTRTADLRITNALLYQLSYIGDTYGIVPLDEQKVNIPRANFPCLPKNSLLLIDSAA